MNVASREREGERKVSTEEEKEPLQFQGLRSSAFFAALLLASSFAQTKLVTKAFKFLEEETASLK